MIIAGVENLELETRFEQAQKRIILSAPPYAPFAHHRLVRHALFMALARTDGPTLTALDLPGVHAAPWMDDLRKLLRPQADAATMQAEIDDSRLFLHELHRNFPQRVQAFRLQTRPNFPFLIVDDVVLFGHFAHAPVLTPQGFWGMVTAPVEELLRLAESDTVPTHMPPRQVGAYRIVAEHIHQLRHALPL